MTSRERLLPYYFRDDPHRLYACRHFPASKVPDSSAVVICNSTGHEYERCHKAMRQLAVQLAKAGLSAMRFDYFGTGDSDGLGDEASLARWRGDIGSAIDECRQRTGRQKVTVFGLRLGATLAAQAMAGRDDVDTLILYAPVIDGRSLLAEWRDAQAAHDRVQGRTASSPVLTEVLGYPLTDSFRAELLSDLAVLGPRASLRRVLILAEPGVQGRIDELTRIMGSGGARVTVETTDVQAIWRREPMEAIVPFKLIRRVVTWLKEAQR
jgi:uncharacterized protein